ncbi:hypothetical protein RYX36_013832 [Vicia faba]
MKGPFPLNWIFISPLILFLLFFHQLLLNRSLDLIVKFFSSPAISHPENASISGSNLKCNAIIQTVCKPVVTLVELNNTLFSRVNQLTSKIFEKFLESFQQDR